MFRLTDYQENMEANVPPQPPMLTRNAVVRKQIPEGGEARGAFEAELARLGLEGRSDVEVSEQRPPEDVAALMGIPTHELAVTGSRRMYASDLPVELATSWLPADIVGTNEELYDADPGPGGIYSRLAELGYGPVTVTETVRLRLPDDDESRFLQLNAEQPVYAIRRTATDETGRVVEVDDSVLPAHQWELVYTWPAETPALARKRPQAVRSAALSLSWALVTGEPHAATAGARPPARRLRRVLPKSWPFEPCRFTSLADIPDLFIGISKRVDRDYTITADSTGRCNGS
jgi:DNA-binding GntR family transcriptional regulator